MLDNKKNNPWNENPQESTNYPWDNNEEETEDDGELNNEEEPDDNKELNNEAEIEDDGEEDKSIYSSDNNNVDIDSYGAKDHSLDHYITDTDKFQVEAEDTQELKENDTAQTDYNDYIDGLSQSFTIDKEEASANKFTLSERASKTNMTKGNFVEMEKFHRDILGDSYDEVMEGLKVSGLADTSNNSVNTPDVSKDESEEDSTVSGNEEGEKKDGIAKTVAKGTLKVAKGAVEGVSDSATDFSNLVKTAAGVKMDQIDESKRGILESLTAGLVRFGIDQKIASATVAYTVRGVSLLAGISPHVRTVQVLSALTTIGMYALQNAGHDTNVFNMFNDVFGKDDKKKGAFLESSLRLAVNPEDGNGVRLLKGLADATLMSATFGTAGALFKVGKKSVSTLAPVIARSPEAAIQNTKINLTKLIKETPVNNKPLVSVGQRQNARDSLKKSMTEKTIEESKIGIKAKPETAKLFTERLKGKVETEEGKRILEDILEHGKPVNLSDAKLHLGFVEGKDMSIITSVNQSNKEFHLIQAEALSKPFLEAPTQKKGSALIGKFIEALRPTGGIFNQETGAQAQEVYSTARNVMDSNIRKDKNFQKLTKNLKKDVTISDFKKDVVTTSDMLIAFQESNPSDLNSLLMANILATNGKNINTHVSSEVLKRSGLTIESGNFSRKISERLTQYTRKTIAEQGGGEVGNAIVRSFFETALASPYTLTKVAVGNTLSMVSTSVEKALASGIYKINPLKNRSIQNRLAKPITSFKDSVLMLHNATVGQVGGLYNALRKLNLKDFKIQNILPTNMYEFTDHVQMNIRVADGIAIKTISGYYEFVKDFGKELGEHFLKGLKGEAGSISEATAKKLQGIIIKDSEAFVKEVKKLSKEELEHLGSIYRTLHTDMVTKEAAQEAISASKLGQKSIGSTFAHAADVFISELVNSGINYAFGTQHKFGVWSPIARISTAFLSSSTLAMRRALSYVPGLNFIELFQPLKKQMTSSEITARGFVGFGITAAAYNMIKPKDREMYSIDSELGVTGRSDKINFERGAIFNMRGSTFIQIGNTVVDMTPFAQEFSVSFQAAQWYNFARIIGEGDPNLTALATHTISGSTALKGVLMTAVGADKYTQFIRKMQYQDSTVAAIVEPYLQALPKVFKNMINNTLVDDRKVEINNKNIEILKEVAEGNLENHRKLQKKISPLVKAFVNSVQYTIFGERVEKGTKLPFIHHPVANPEHADAHSIIRNFGIETPLYIPSKIDVKSDVGNISGTIFLTEKQKKFYAKQMEGLANDIIELYKDTYLISDDTPINFESIAGTLYKREEFDGQEEAEEARLSFIKELKSLIADRKEDAKFEVLLDVNYY